jgi:LacI family repressor for deo operon, udp, cdd, tsx, nupC, and nupG
LGAAYAMTRHLLDLGHRRIAFAFHPVRTWDPVGQERLAGFKKAMAEAGLTREATLLLDATELEAGRILNYRPESIETCFRRKDRPTALFAGMDSLAIQAMETLRGLGLAVPRDVSVAGFDDIEFSRFTQPSLTTVSQPIQAMAVRASQLLFEQIKARTVSRKKIAERLPCNLVIRSSCAPPPSMRSQG